MSFAGQVLCQRMLIGPWALTTVGAVTVAAVTTAAPRRNLRRLVWLGREDCDMASPWLLMDAIRPRERRFWIGWPFLELRAGSWGPLGLNLPARFPPPVGHFYEEMCFRTSRELASEVSSGLT